MVNVDPVAGRLQLLEAAMDRISQELLDLDANPTRKLLGAAPLAGETKHRAQRAEQALVVAWDSFRLFKDALDRARSLRGNRAELDHLLRSPSIEIPPTNDPTVPPSRSPAPPVRVTVEQLVTSTEAALRVATEEVRLVEAAWHGLLPRLESASRDLAEVQSLAGVLGGAPDPTVARLRVTIDRLATTVTTDPLAVAEADVIAAERALVDVAGALRQQAVRRDRLGSDLAAAETELSEITQLMADGVRAGDETRAKILAPQGLLATLDPACLTETRTGLRPWLDRLLGLAARGEWRASRRGLDDWQVVALRTAEAARQIVTANRSPVAERNELRGRLDAYRAKAGRLGFAEDPSLSAEHAAARDALHVAPADLAKAAVLVSGYGAMVSATERPATERPATERPVTERPAPERPEEERP